MSTPEGDASLTPSAVNTPDAAMGAPVDAARPAHGCAPRFTDAPGVSFLMDVEFFGSPVASFARLNGKTPLSADLVPIRASFRNLSLIRHFRPPFLSLNSQDTGKRTTKAQVFFVGESHVLDG
jgi:hypothetical protein